MSFGKILFGLIIVALGLFLILYMAPLYGPIPLAIGVLVLIVGAVALLLDPVEQQKRIIAPRCKRTTNRTMEIQIGDDNMGEQKVNGVQLIRCIKNKKQEMSCSVMNREDKVLFRENNIKKIIVLGNPKVSFVSSGPEEETIVSKESMTCQVYEKRMKKLRCTRTERKFK